MKITHFNGFDEDNNFRRQLKQKMQNFEPEVSNTLWDRIELNLANQEERKSKKGLWILVWFLSIGFTAMLTWGVYDYTSTNKSTEISVQNENPLYVNSEKTQKLPLADADNISTENSQTNTLLDVPKNAAESTSANLPAHNSLKNLTANNYTPQKSNHSFRDTRKNDFKSDNNTSNNSGVNTSVNDAKKHELKTLENIKPKGTETFPLAKITDIHTSFLAINDSNKETKSTLSEEGKKLKKPGAGKLNLERLSIAFYQVSAYNYRTVKTVEGSSPIPEMARADDKNNYEKGAMSYKNISLNLQYKIAEHWYMSAGYGSYSLQNKVQFDSLRKKELIPILSVNYGNEKDSAAIGNGKTYQSSWNVIQIPVEITYKNNITKRLSYIVGTGIEYNIVKNYMYRMFDAKFRNDFIPIEKGNKYDQQFPDAGFKNYFSAQLRAGTEYQISGRWSIRVNAYGSRSVQSYSKKESGIDTKPYRFGLQTGLIFSLK